MTELNINIHDNPLGWGPTGDEMPLKFQNVPFSPQLLYSQQSTQDRLKQSQQQGQQSSQQQQTQEYKLGRVADWSQPQRYDQQAKRRTTTGGQQGGPRSAAAQAAAAAAAAEEEFAVVSRTVSSASSRTGGQMGGRGDREGGARGAGGMRGQGQMGGRSGPGGMGGRSGPQSQQRRGGMRGERNVNRALQQLAPSIHVRKTWDLKNRFDFDQLRKLVLPGKGNVDVETLREVGFVLPYDASFDQVTLKKKRALDPAAAENKLFFTVTTSDDPIIREIAEQELEDQSKKQASTSGDDASQQYTVYVTDNLLTTLMSSIRSVLPWDIIIEKNGNQLFIDKRSNSEDIDLLTVNETSRDPPLLDEATAGINSLPSLRKEATFIQQAFSQQVLRKDAGKVQAKGAEANPFQEGRSDEEIGAISYRYRRWRLSDSINVVARCEAHAAVSAQSDAADPQYLTVHALNEYTNQTYVGGDADSVRNTIGMDWRTNLDSQRASVLVTELKNNSNKLSQWVAQSLLVGAQQMKLGFVSRVNPKSNLKHVILAVERIVPQQFAQQFEVSMNNMWAIVKHVIEQIVFKHQQDGKYILVKEPNKTSMKLYLLPEGGLDEDEDHGAFSDDDASVATEDVEAEEEGSTRLFGTFDSRWD